MKVPLLHSLALALLAMPLAAQEGTETTPAAAEPTPAAPKLVVGSAAPALKAAQWLKGDPVASFDKDKTYLIECWATWCGSCVEAIPHVNALHQKFKDKGLVVIGMNVWEDDLKKAEAFVKSQGDAMAYRVAYDGKPGDFAPHWLAAAGVTGIPHAFVIRDNKLHWQGHPGELTEETVSAMLGGTFDAQKAAAAVADRQELIREMIAAEREFDALVEAKKPEEAAVKLARQIELAPKLGAPAEAIGVLKSRGLAKIALARGNAEEAVAILKRNIPAEGLEPSQAATRWYQAANAMITTPGLGKARDYAFALDCIDKAVAADPSFERLAVIRILKARALDAIGRKDESLKLVERADEHGILESLIEEHAKIRQALQAGKPWPAGSMNPDAPTP